MFAFLSRLRKRCGMPFRTAQRRGTRLGLPLAAGLALAACDPGALTPAPRVDVSRAVQVALILPNGSGDAGNDIIARSLENAARLAIADLAGVEIDLRIYSDGGQATGAAAAAAQAAQDGARIILGPLFADGATAAGQAVAGRGLSVVSFSNNPSAAGGNVFILGQTFANTAERLLRHAAAQNRGRVLVIHERTPAGEVGRDAIVASAGASGAVVAGVQGFDFSQQGVVEALPAIADSARSSGAQALFFTSNTAGALPLLTQLLPQNRIGPDTYQYIGLTRWDIPPETLALPGVQGGWFALPDPALQAQFAARYQAAYGAPPHPLAGLAYDGIAAIGALLATGRPDALSPAALMQPQGFAGVGGVFRFRADGTNERGLAIATIRDNAVVVIDPAPRAFPGAGF